MFYCGVRLRPKGPYMRTKDHVVPKSKGGTKTVEACLKCNADKKDMSLEEFRRKRGGIEFWGERAARLEREKTVWWDEFGSRGAVRRKELISPSPPPEKRTIVAQDTQRPTYESTFDLSKITHYISGAKAKQEKKAKQQEAHPNNHSTSHIPNDLTGVKFGRFTVVGRITGKWVVECVCGAIDHRTSKAVRNPLNSWDCCDDCREPLGKLRSDIYAETGVKVSWEDCFQHIYGENGDLCKSMAESMRSESMQEAGEMSS